MIELKINYLATIIIIDSNKNYKWMQKLAGEKMNEYMYMYN